MNTIEPSPGFLQWVIAVNDVLTGQNSQIQVEADDLNAEIDWANGMTPSKYAGKVLGITIEPTTATREQVERKGQQPESFLDEQTIRDTASRNGILPQNMDAFVAQFKQMFKNMNRHHDGMSIEQLRTAMITRLQLATEYAQKSEWPPMILLLTECAKMSKLILDKSNHEPAKPNQL